MPKIALTTFYNERYKPLAEITIPVMEQYCLKHGYYLNINKIEQDNFHFVKTKDTRKLLDEFDVVMGIEADVLITNLNIKVEEFLDDKNDLYITNDINNINFGTFICKSSDWTKILFDWVNMQSDRFGDEQEIFERNHNIEKTKIVHHPCFNSIPYEHYAPSFGKIGYKNGDIVSMPTAKEGNWEKGHFVCHTPGLGFEQRLSILNEIKQQIIYE